MDTELEQLLHDAMDKKIADAKGFFNTTKRKVIGVIVALIVIFGIVLVSHAFNSSRVNDIADRLRTEFQADNRALYDNLAVLKDRTQQLEYQYGVQKGELANLRNKLKGDANNAFKNPNKQVAASYFDNTIDSYIPSK